MAIRPRVGRLDRDWLWPVRSAGFLRSSLPWLTLWLVLVALAFQAAQGEVPLVLGKSTATLTGPWRFRTGDDLAWASPNWNDSAWQEVSLAPIRVRPDPMFGGQVYLPGWTAKGHPGYYGYAWYRLNLTLASPHTGLAIQMPGNYDDAYQLYVNGVLAGQDGYWSSDDVSPSESSLRVFPLPDLKPGGRMTIAVRMYMRPETALAYPEVGGMHSPPVLGTLEALKGAERGSENRRLRLALFDIPTILICLFVGVVAGGFFLLDRDEPAYLWLAAATAALAAFSTLDLMNYIVASLSLTTFTLVQTALLLPLSYLCWFLFWTYWFRLEKQKFLLVLGFTGAILVASLAVLLSSPLFGTFIPVRAALFLRPLQAAVWLGCGLLLLWVAYSGIRRYGVEGWLALLPIALLSLWPFNDRFQVAWLPVNLFVGGVRITLFDLTAVLSLLATSVLLLRRFLSVQKERERIAGELKAAHTLQSLVLACEKTVTPQFSVETIYQPAQEVGGDFFQVLSGEAGSIMVVVGDVSGKGLRAAMTVSTIIGALRREESRQPRLVLKELNRVLLGQSGDGFTTCVCALIEANGRVTLANAGHPPPYRSGAEIPVYGGLPLGLVADTVYEEIQVHVDPGDQLTFVSDGVVEARNGTGLFGFDRTRAISREPAAAIVAAAKAFGQEDDITVLTVSFLAQPVEATARA